MNKVSEAEVAALLASGEFDERSYLDKYPDVALLGMSAAEHYLWIGKRLGRTLSPARPGAPRPRDLVEAHT
jgi:O-antigen biosynthesis protein